MASIKELYVSAINEGMRAAKGIPDAKDKAMAYAALASAIARSGQVTPGSSNIELSAEDVTQAKESLKPDTTKAKKEEAAPKTKAEPKPKIEKPKASAEPEPKEEGPELVGEWNEEMLELKAAEIEKFQTLREEAGEELLNRAVVMFSEGKMTETGDITPINIDDFLAFVDANGENINLFEQCIEAYGEETIIECISNFSEGALKAIDDINGRNLDAFIEFMKMLAEQAEDEE